MGVDMRVYYNEFDKKKCAALQALMEDGYIRKGDIDDRPIQEVRANDVASYDRCHFFAGIGLWDYALNLARWPEDRRVWTGSCPCQPFSSAGRQEGKADDRHLWPEWARLITECRPPTFFGEQVATAVAHGWLDDVYEGLEAQSYAVGSAVLPACSIGAPHRRDRLWFVGNREHNGSPTDPQQGGDVAITDSASEGGRGLHRPSEGGCPQGSGANGEPVGRCDDCNVADNEQQRSQGQGQLRGEWEAGQPIYDSSRHWENGVWVECPDGKARLVEPGIPLLAHGYPERVGLIHAAGDAIVPQVAEEFVRAFMESKYEIGTKAVPTGGG